MQTACFSSLTVNPMKYWTTKGPKKFVYGGSWAWIPKTMNISLVINPN